MHEYGLVSFTKFSSRRYDVVALVMSQKKLREQALCSLFDSEKGVLYDIEGKLKRVDIAWRS